MNIESRDFHVGMAGEFRCKLWNSDGSLARDTGWRKNLILDTGIIYPTISNSWATWFSVGSNSTAANVAQTALLGYMASSNDSQGDINSAAGSAPNYEVSRTRTMRFDAGVATGTIQEMCVNGEDGNTLVFNRHVISPPVEKGATQVLDVSYRLTLYPPLTPNGANGIVIGGVTYDTSTNGLSYTSPSVAGNVFGQYGPSSNDSVWNLYDGLLAPNTSNSPLGDFGQIDFTGENTWLGTTSNSGLATRQFERKFTLNAGNAPLLCRTAKATTLWGWGIQTEFTATTGGDIGGPVPKDENTEFTPRWQISWGRK